MTSNTLQEYIKDKIFIVEYPHRFGGMDIFGRMTLVRLGSGELWVHDPCQIDQNLKSDEDSPN